MPEIDQEVTLMAAAHALGISYERARRKLLVGELSGRQDEAGRWLVERESLNRHRAATAATVAA
ncbi:MAG: hypothetical protein M3Z05_15430 [Gemmatimonadota bacterium]|nr:hypothetical protein [Gemmatimonadota bacterium]